MSIETITRATDRRAIRVPQPTSTHDAMGIEIADAPEALSVIHRPACGAAIWDRQPLRAFQTWIDGVEPKRLPRGRVTLRPDMVRAAVLGLCENHNTPDDAMREALVDDIAALATVFAGLMDASFVKLRLDVVTANTCPKFHIDAITARLICTYRGTGTQYGASTNGEVPKTVFTVPTSSPMVLRGSVWPQSPAKGVVHRSPPIAGTGETRLVLVLDPAENPD